MKMLAQFAGSAEGTGLSRYAQFKDLDEQLRFLRKQITKYRMVPVIRDTAIGILGAANIAARDKRSQALSIGDWAQENIYYVHELPERFQTPESTLRTKAGDCDDFSTLIGALAESIGIPVMLVAMHFRGAYRHIFPAAKIDGKLLPLDATNRFGGVRGENPVHSSGKVVKLKIA